MRCYDCVSWGDGDGVGYPYDAGHMNYCNHPSIAGNQHPSYGACGEPTTMVYDDRGCSKATDVQRIMTRGKFGCVLFTLRKGVTSKA